MAGDGKPDDLRNHHASGSVERTGAFREEFFIVVVDWDYGIRARARGFRLLVSGEPLMVHPVGEET